MQVSYQLAIQDFKEGIKACRRKSVRSRWSFALTNMILVVFIIAGMLLIANLDLEQPLYAKLVFLAAVSFFWVFVLWLAPYLSARSQFRGSPNAKNPVTLEASESGLHFQTVHSDSKLQWSALVTWVEQGSVFALFTQPRIFIAVPKRAFSSEQLNEFRELLRRNIK